MEENKNYVSVDDLIKQAEEQYVDFIKSDKYKDLLLSMSNLNCYTLNNQMLILSQLRTAKCVNGMKVWNFNGRNIKKGEKALKIIAPLTEKKKKEEMDENGNIVDVEDVEIKGYKVAYVFDISQTEGRELYDFSCNTQMAIENFETIKDALEVVPKGFTVRYEDLDESKDGYCDYQNKEIVIKNGMNYEKTLTTLIHEIGHALSETRFRNNFKGLTNKEQRQIREIEAESIALVVSNRLGLETTDFNMSYIASWSEGDIEKFKENIGVVRSVSYQILSKVEPALQSALREKEKQGETAVVSEEKESKENIQQAEESAVLPEKKAKSKAKSKQSGDDELC